ncbi:MAG: hypothetical protein QF662_07380, partial [Phycisphaerae bacterium]|nr:hypothetical protein [Phycisphaerae bacterium]
MKNGTRAALAVAIGLAVIIAAALLYRTLTANRFEKYVREKIAESKAAGDPLLLADIAPRPVADADNAAPVYERAFAALKLPRDNPEDRKRWRD